MKQIVKKLSTFVLVIGILTTSFSFVVSAESFSSEPVLTKEQFANLHASEYKAEFENSTENAARYQFISEYFASPTSTSDFMTASPKSSDLTVADEKLNELGFYIYSHEDLSITTMSSSGDIQFSNITVLYDSSNGTWAIVGGGYWISTNWLVDAGEPWFESTKDVGGLDAIGLIITNLSTSSDVDFIPINSYGYIHNGIGGSRYLYNRSTPNYEDGVMFTYQDYIFKENGTFSEYKYMGQGFSATMIYDNSTFTQYDGRVAVEYVHTWDETTIEGVSLGIDSFGINFKNGNSQFIAISTATGKF